MKFTNVKMEQMLSQLEPILRHRDKVGYVAARNTRILRDNLTEFLDFKNELIQKYGTSEKDENGNETGRISISPTSPNFQTFSDEFDKIADIEHEVDLMTLKYNEVIGILNGEEILELDWMLED